MVVVVAAAAAVVVVAVAVAGVGALAWLRTMTAASFVRPHGVARQVAVPVPAVGVVVKAVVLMRLARQRRQRRPLTLGAP